MQGDGNLVLYRAGVALWDSGTHGHPGAGAYLQADANLVVYSSAETGRRALFDTGTSIGDTGTALFPSLRVEDLEVSVDISADDTFPEALWGSSWDSDRVRAGDELDLGDRRRNASGCVLVMQHDGNLVEYCAGVAVFSTGVPSRPQGPFTHYTARMQADGNLVLYQEDGLGERPAVALFATGTRTPGSVLRLQDDRNLVVLAPGGRPTWSRLTGRIR